MRPRRIGIAILAAGGSRRFGSPKQLLPFGDTTLLEAIAIEACAASCDRVAIVLGAHGDAIAPTLEGLPVTLLVNHSWHEGIASSIRCAVRWAVPCDALLLLVCDQPRLTATHLDRLIDAYCITRRPIGSRYGGAVGVPAIFGAADFTKLAALHGDVGARAVLANTLPGAIDWPEGAFDIDTRADSLALTA